MHLLLCTVPNSSDGSTAASIKSSLSGSFGKAQVIPFELPIKQLTVGTLDSLIALSDDLAKVSSSTDNVARKIERQFHEILASVDDPSLSSADKTLRVNDVSVEAYLQNFSWDFSKYQVYGRPLSELAGHMQSIAAKAEEDLKQLSTTYADKTVALGTVLRRKAVSLVTSDFEDFLSEGDVDMADMQDSENLLSLMVAVPKGVEKDFLASYDSAMSADIAFFGPATNRGAERGSPVVPGSARKVAEEGDAVLYAITVLRGHTEAGCYDMDGVFQSGAAVDYVLPLKAAFREKKCVVRDFCFDPQSGGGVEAAVEKAEAELTRARGQFLRWCKSHFGEVFVASIHLKMVRAFVESVLRYGLPINFCSFFVEVPGSSKEQEKELVKALTATVTRVCPDLAQKRLLVGTEEDEEEDTRGGEGGGSDAAMDSLPFVCQSFAVPGAK